MGDSENNDDVRSSSTGHVFSESEWLDAHFAWMRPEYEDMLRWVGLKRGWRVLDAASGPGSFLPLMTELVGAEGRIDAIDLAPENIVVLENRMKVERWNAPVFGRVGNILDLPYETSTFDAVWCANTTQYLTDDQLRQMLKEFRRVVRPGGYVAIKEYDITLQQIHPTLPMFNQHFNEAMLKQSSPEYQAYYHQLFRALSLPQWLREVGLTEVRQKPTFILRQQPISESGKTFMRDFFRFCIAEAAELDLPEEDKPVWQQLADFDSPKHLFNHPDFQYRCIQTVLVGTNPS